MHTRKSLHILPREDVIIKHAFDFNKAFLDLRGLQLENICLPTRYQDRFCKIYKVDISFNLLKKFPDCLTLLENLQVLRLCQNKISFIPEEIKNLRQLQVLDVSHNQLQILPKCLGTMGSLEMVNCSGNKLTSLQREFFTGPHITSFNLTYNPIKNVPQNIYLGGIVPLQQYFNIASSDTHVRRRLHLGNLNEETFSERLQGIKLRRTKKRERLKELALQQILLDTSIPPKSPKSLLHFESAGQSQTSDYGSCSGSVPQEECYPPRSSVHIENDVSSCCGDRGSDIADVRELDHRGESPPISFPEPDFQDETEELDLILPNRARFLKTNNVCVVIPEHNKMNYLRQDFYLKFMPEERYKSNIGNNCLLVSPVVYIGPNAAEFYEDQPALICLPIIRNTSGGRIRCFCSNTSEFDPPEWEEVPSSDFQLRPGYVVIKTLHLSLYAAVLDMSPPVVSRLVSPEDGGILEVDQVPGVKIVFPTGAVEKSILATVKVHCKDLSLEQRGNLDPEDAFASPVVVLSPHGYIFSVNHENPVHIHLPIPNYTRITEEFGSEAQLSVWHSPTQESDPVAWQPLDVEYTLYSNEKDEHFIDIPVTHFSWLTTMWDSIRSRMNFSDSVGAVPMKCQAWMLENENSNKFGLVVICHNAENSMQEMGNYSINVGGSLKPVIVAPDGDIIVRLSKSNYFEADTGVDEDETLEKVEANYKGGDFEMQFACCFTGENKPTNKDIFGRVYVKKRKQDGSEEMLFQFNLIKKSEASEEEHTDPWTTASLRELADMHNITTGDNWKRFATALGFSHSEIKNKFTKLADPFAEIVSVYRRQRGSHDEFMHKLYSVARDLKMNPGDDEESETGERMSTWRNMFGSWFGNTLGSTGSGSQQSSSTRGGDPSDDEEQRPSTSRFNANRKRVLPTSGTGTSGSSSSKRRRTRAATQEQQTHEHLFEQLQISPEHSPSGSSESRPGALGALYNRTPTHNSMAGPSSTTLVQSGTGGLMSTMSSMFRPNPPMTEFLAGAVPSSSQPSLPQPHSQRRLDDDFIRCDITEISQPQLYRIAPLIQSHWVKVARLVRNDENVEADIRMLQEQFPTSPEEQATQMLLQWREKCPDVCNRGRLYSALCDLNLKTVAKKCNEIYLRS